MAKVIYAKYEHPTLYYSAQAISHLVEVLGGVKIKKLSKYRAEMSGRYGKVSYKEVWDSDDSVAYCELRYNGKRAKFDIDMHGIVLHSKQAEKVIGEALLYLAEKVNDKFRGGK